MILLATLPAVLVACATTAEPGATPPSSLAFTLAYQGAVDGEIEPCG